jgi:dolichol-phosphate mannosyltransferase
MIPDLSIIVPTLNEQDNIVPLIERLRTVLIGIKWEVIFVDDNSQDGTLDVLQALARQDERVRYIRRIERWGLASACLDGLSASSAPYLAVMDADLQHDETILPEMYKKIQEGELDLVIGSRYVSEGGIKLWDQRRQFMSRIATRLARLALRVDISDPMSGFFMLNRHFLYEVQDRVSGLGFKILLDLIASSKTPIRFAEVPFVFRPRHTGTSKLDALVVWEYLLLLFDKTIGQYIPVRFVMFVLVGALGSIFHVGILGLLLHFMEMSFLMSQSVATFFAITVNFVGNNLFTYRDKRLKGIAILQGLILFYLVCAIGAFINIRVAVYLFRHDIIWWLAGLLGAMIGAVWNFATSSVLVWPYKRK